MTRSKYIPNYEPAPCGEIARLQEILAILKAGRELLAQYGWCRNTYYREPFFVGDKALEPWAHCALGAIRYPFGFTNKRHGWEVIDMAFGALSRTVWIDIRTWNDADGRTKQEVLDVYDTTIERVEYNLERLGA